MQMCFRCPPVLRRSSSSTPQSWACVQTPNVRLFRPSQSQSLLQSGLLPTQVGLSSNLVILYCRNRTSPSHAHFKTANPRQYPGCDSVGIWRLLPDTCSLPYSLRSCRNQPTTLCWHVPTLCLTGSSDPVRHSERVWFFKSLLSQVIINGYWY